MDILSCLVGLMLFIVMYTVMQLSTTAYQSEVLVSCEPAPGSRRVVVLAADGAVRMLDTRVPLRELLSGFEIVQSVDEIQRLIAANPRAPEDRYFTFGLKYEFRPTTRSASSAEPTSAPSRRRARPQPRRARGSRLQDPQARPPRGVGDAGGARRATPPASGTLVPFAAAVVAILVIDMTVPPDGYIFRLFRPQGGWLMAVVPGLTAFAFFWACADLFLKLRITRVDEADLARPEITRLPALVAQKASGVTLHRLRGWDGRVLARPVGRRVHWLLQHLDTTDSARAHELIRHQSDLEVDGAASGYRVVKLLIWAMPILGFIGTVLGISIAVGGFAEFLTSTVSIDEISRVTTELGAVASGLSFALDTTLIGLVGGLVASVLSARSQGRGQGHGASPTESTPAPCAPLLAASMMPGPPPVMMAHPSAVSAAARRSVAW